MPLVPEKIQSIAAAIKNACGFLAKQAGWLLENIHTLFLAIDDTLLERVEPEKRRWVYLTVAGILSVILIVVVMGVILRDAEAAKAEMSSAAREMPRHAIIPPDELFLPDEPDFIPGVMLEREQRTHWTAADAVPLWQDPLKNGEHEWRSLLEKTVDEIMESVP